MGRISCYKRKLDLGPELVLGILMKDEECSRLEDSLYLITKIYYVISTNKEDRGYSRLKIRTVSIINFGTIYNLQSTIYNLQSTIYDLQSAIYNLQSTINNQKSTIYNQQTTIYNLQSTIYKLCNLQSLIYNQQSKVYNLQLIYVQSIIQSTIYNLQSTL